MSDKDVGKLKLILLVIVLVAVAGQLVEAFTGDFLKTIALNVKIIGIEFSITAFAIATLIVKTLLFGW